MTVFTQRMVMLAILFTAGIGQAFAQLPGVNFVDPRLTVNGPSSIAGSKIFNWSQAPSNTTPWGGQITGPYYQVALEKAYDTVGLNPLLNGTAGYPSLTGKFAVILRGAGVSFSRKAKLCQDAGAIGVIIVNHKNGGTIGMAPTLPESGLTTIPVLIISREDGFPINDALKAGQQVSINLGNWGVGKTHDLGFVDASGAAPHSFAIPLTQITNGTGTPREFQFYNGSFLGNFGTATETNVKVKHTLNWTPTGGSPTQIWDDSVSLASFPQTDSIGEFLSDRVFRRNFTTTGMLSMNYTATAAVADENPTDNSMSYTAYITDSVYCKSRWSMQRGMPIVTASYRYSAVQPLVWGPLFYVTKGGYRAYRAQLAISGDSDRLFENPTPPSVFVRLYKWSDANSDGLVNGDELSIEATGFKTSFTQADLDSSNKPFMVNLTNARNTRLIPRVTDNSWYFLAVELENSFGLGADNETSYFTRNHLSTYVDSSATSRTEYWAPNTSENLFEPNYVVAADTLSNISFFNKSIVRAAQVAYKNVTGLVPAVALHLSKEIPVSVEATPGTAFSKLEIYPNPANDKINLNIGLTSQQTIAVGLVNSIGQSMYYKVNHGYNGGSMSISTASMPAGTYYLTVASENGSDTRAITILHD